MAPRAASSTVTKWFLPDPRILTDVADFKNRAESTPETGLPAHKCSQPIKPTPSDKTYSVVVNPVLPIFIINLKNWWSSFRLQFRKNSDLAGTLMRFRSSPLEFSFEGRPIQPGRIELRETPTIFFTILSPVKPVSELSADFCVVSGLWRTSKNFKSPE